MSLNKACLIGNVGQDPEVKFMNNGNAVANLSIATSESWKDKTTGEKKEKTEWHRVVVFGPIVQAVIEPYVKKGTKLYLEGKMQTRKWTNNEGVDVYTTEVVLQGFGSVLQLLNKVDGNTQQAPQQHQSPAKPQYNQQPQQQPTQSPETSMDFDDDIPF